MSPAKKRPARSKAKRPARAARPSSAAPYSVPPGKVLILRTCLADMRSPSSDAKGFVWPRSGPVECADWNPAKRCGNGLHGALWGEGSGDVPWVWSEEGVWIVVEADEDSIVNLDGKVKFPRGVVVFAGPRYEATSFLARLAPGRSIIGSLATAGYRGTATAGDRGTATAGDSGTATAGDSGTATAGDSGTATAGDSGELRIREWDPKASRYRTRVAWVGEDGIKAKTPYVLVDGKFTEKKS